MQWLTLFQKELLESWRNYKWIWFPLVLIVLAIMDPISSYYMPLIIESVGGLPDGAVMEIPTPLPREVLMMSLGQIGSIGILVIVLISMGTIAGERKSGVAELILVKPVAHAHYITAKFVAIMTMVWISFFLAMVGSWYYTNLLFGEISFVSLLYVIFFYGLWLMFVVSIVVFLNTLFKNAGIIAFLSIIIVLSMSVLTQIFGRFITWSPNNISTYIHEYLITQEVSTDLIMTAIITVVLSAILIMASFFTFEKRD